MRIRSKHCLLLLGLVSGLAQAEELALNEDNIWQLSPEELGQVRLTSIATGTSTPLDKTAAVATVITAEEIRAIGATDLDAILETVPGLHVNHSDQTYTPKYVFRGITSKFNPQALLLINGIPQSTLVFGNRGNVWGGMPVKSIARIEVIRGPGSALYGADAFAGVINIITKSAKDIDGTEVGTSVGSFDSEGLWVLHGGHYGGADVGFTLEANTTGGQSETIQADAQTAGDQAAGTSASWAPGSVNTGVKQLESRLDVAKDNLHFRLGYQGRYDVQVGPGIAQALDPDSRYQSDRVNSDLSYERKDLFKNWDLQGQLSYFFGTQDPRNNTMLFPPGAILNGPFPDGFIGNPGFKEQQARIQLNGSYNGFHDHLLRLGSGYFWGDLYQTTETKNFNPDFSPITGNTLISTSDTPLVWIPENERKSHFLFAQDEWQFASNWQLTSGLRFDHYSDFGSTVNPRLALIWATTDTITTKLLYGRAFRAPNFNELHTSSNPVALGNPDLNPEKIDTYELAFSQQASARWHYSINAFYYRIRDYIDFVSVSAGITEAQNIGRREGHGGEFETSFDVAPNWKLLANYSYQRATDELTDTAVGDAPNHEIYGRSEWSFAEHWRLDTQANWVGSQKRVAGDSRQQLKGYTTVDATLRNTQVIKGLQLALSVRNLFNSAVFDPSPGPGPGLNPSIPGDFPMARRSIYGEAQYQF